MKALAVRWERGVVAARVLAEARCQGAQCGRRGTLSVYFPRGPPFPARRKGSVLSKSRRILAYKKHHFDFQIEVHRVQGAFEAKSICPDPDPCCRIRIRTKRIIRIQNADFR